MTPRRTTIRRRLHIDPTGIPIQRVDAIIIQLFRGEQRTAVIQRRSVRVFDADLEHAVRDVVEDGALATAVVLGPHAD